MKKFYNYLFSIGISTLLVLFLGELFFRYQSKTDSEEIRYKKIHCLYGLREIRLCPNVNEKFLRKDGKIWDIQTNSQGERTLGEGTNPNKLWLVGDSMAMGFGLPTKETPAFYLKSKYQLEARVIAVDAIGTRGVFRLLQDAVKNTDTKEFPNQVYWIWNPSDFIDDEREKKGLKQFFYPFHHKLSQISYLYRNLLPSPQPNVYTSYGIPYQYPENHITYSYLREFFLKNIIPKEKMNLLFSWGMSKAGTPDTKDPNYELAKKFFFKQGINTIDLRTKTEALFKEQKQVYIPLDGHPGPALAELFADAIAKDFLNLP
ncbi:LA_2486 family SGNH/GDSL-type esterase [Leptospira harrisiae]|uniref:LA_2486 family SGNH/GDSL-type esterase n=1 Tax=Leptospira harrisiae TaxID=2023189 RepID=UPI001A9C2CE6